MRTLFLLIVAVLLATSCGAGQNVITNPHMNEWAYGRPVGWNVLGNPLMLYCTPRDGDSAVAVVYDAGCGLTQQVMLQPGKKYYYRVRTIRSARIKVASRNDGKPFFETDVNGDAAGFFTASVADAVVSVVGQDGKSFELKSCQIHSTDPDPMMPRVPVPQIPVFFSGIDPRMLPALGSANMIDGYFDAATTWKLVRRRVVALGCVSIQQAEHGMPIAPGTMQERVDRFVTQLVAPFFDTDEGRLPGGADGIAIDESWTCGNTDDYEPDMTELWERSLAEVRRMFPNKVIALWVSGSLGSVPPEGKTRVRQMRMCEKYCDFTLLELYQTTIGLNQQHYGRNLPAFAQAAEVIHKTCPGLLSKTIVALWVTQKHEINTENSSEYELSEWLRAQMANTPRLGRDGAVGYRGIGAWYFNPSFTRSSTAIAFDKYAREMFLAPAKPKPLTDDSALQRVKDANFELAPSGWSAFGPSDGSRKIDLYAGTNIPTFHDNVNINHFKCFARVTRGSSQGGFRQSVGVEPGKSYEAFVWTLTDGPGAAASISITQGDRILGKVAEPLMGPSQWWVRVAASFTVPRGVTEVELAFTDEGCVPGESVIYDFAGISPLDGANEPTTISSIGTINLNALPAQVTIKGRNIYPNSIVRIGNDIYCDVAYVSNKEMRVMVPMLPSSGNYDITVSRRNYLGDPQPITVPEGLRVK